MRLLLVEDTQDLVILLAKKVKIAHRRVCG